MAPRTRTQSSGAASARSARSVTSRRSGVSTDSSAELSASTRASSFSASNGGIYSPTLTEGGIVMAPPTTPEDPLDMINGARSLNASLDALYAPTASYVNMVHMDQMAQYFQTTETQQSIDTLLSLVKSKADAFSGGAGGGAGPDEPDYHTALDELDYLEGLFKKLRFSYKEQLTKETVVRRILELELPLLSAADIDHIVRDTEAERQQLRQIKAEGQAQGAAAEKLIRDLATERAYVAMAEAETKQLPDRVLRLRHRLARMKLALQAELEAIDSVGSSVALDANSHACATCGRSFYSEAFRQLHQAMHSLQGGARGMKSEEGSDLVDFGDEAAAAAAVASTALRQCRGCTQMVPALFLDAAAPKGETHKAFHARIRATAADAREKLVAATESSSSAKAALQLEDMALQGETEEVLRQLQSSEADLAALEKRVRSEAERQAAIEGEMTQSLQHLRESVGSIRLEMARIEQEADRMVQYLEEGRTHLGRSLQEQTDLFNVLLLGDDNDDDDDEDEDEDEEMAE